MDKKFKYPKGSIWRKWDLHVHTPASTFGHSFSSWEDYIRTLIDSIEKHKISVIVTADYFTIEGYRKLLSYYDKEKKILSFDGKSVEVNLIPGVELRLNNFNSSDESINIHALFDPNFCSPDFIESNFIEKLKINYRTRSLDLKKQNILAVGKAILKNVQLNIGEDFSGISETDRKAYTEAALKAITLSKTDINDALKDISEIFDVQGLKNKQFLLAVAGKGYGGLQDLKWFEDNKPTFSRMGLVREDLTCQSDLIFSNNLNDIQFYLGKREDTDEREIADRFNRRKPCIWGSDSSTLDNLLHPSNGATLDYTWIKADPTFEGLRQIIYEPEDRVYIGEEPPSKFENNKIIKALAITDSNGWFTDEKIEINPDMVSLIGGKGSGKTALLDMIAFALNKDWKEIIKSTNTFLGSAIKEIENASVKVFWNDGTDDSLPLNSYTSLARENKKEKQRKVIYLSQGFITSLCAKEHVDELQQQIEKVIFQKIKDEDKAIFSSFEEYKNSQLKIIKNEQREIVNELHSANEAIDTAFNLIVDKENVQKQIEQKKKDLEDSEKESKKLSNFLKGNKNESLFNEYKKLNQEKISIEKEISTLKSSVLKITEVKQRVGITRKHSNNFVDEINDIFQIVGIEEKLKIEILPADIIKILDNYNSKKNESISEKVTDLKKKNEKLNAIIEKLQLEKSRHNKVTELGGLEKKNKEELESLEKRLESINQTEQNIGEMRTNQEELFLKYFTTLFEEKQILKNIYKPLEEILEDSKDENEQFFRFQISLRFADKLMTKSGDPIIDHRKDGRYQHTNRNLLFEDLTKDIRKQLFSIDFDLPLTNDDGVKVLHETNKINIKEFINKIKTLFDKDTVELYEKKVKDQLIQDCSIKDFYDWLYSVDYYKLTYSIKFNGKDLDALSPGLKGVALLILYLELDKDDNRPILIDQPEENLDNRFIYTTLVKYFTRAKKHRQVLIATHNANLVVNTDSEQVIVANFEKEKKDQPSIISYVSGGLENTFKDKNSSTLLAKMGIKEHVCLVLEGGQRAFQEREQKYNFPKI